jgi:uncharacterized damage-inducible protein DinB
MSASRNIRMLTRYTVWANARLFEALAALPEGEAQARRPTLFGNMVSTLSHSYVVDLIWQAHLCGQPHGFKTRNTETQPALGELGVSQAAIDQWYVNYADGLAEDRLNDIVDFKFVDGGAGSMTRGDMADMLYQASSRPPVMDLPVFLRDVPLVL